MLSRRRRLVLVSASAVLHVSLALLLLEIVGARARAPILVDLTQEVLDDAVAPHEEGTAPTRPAWFSRAHFLSVPRRADISRPSAARGTPTSSTDDRRLADASPPPSLRDATPSSPPAAPTSPAVASIGLAPEDPKLFTEDTPIPGQRAAIDGAAAASTGGGLSAEAGASAGAKGSDSGATPGMNGSDSVGALVAAGDGRGGLPPDYASYLRRFRRRIADSIEYPLAARRQGLAGTVELEVLLEPSGRVVEARVVASSSHAVLDEAALDAVKRVAAEPFPERLPRRPLRVRLPLAFELE